MLILKYNNENVNSKKIKIELKSTLNENFILSYDETEFKLHFQDLKEIETQEVDDNGEVISTSVSVAKLTKSTETVTETITSLNENGEEITEEVEKEIEVVKEEEFDINNLKAQIQNVIDNHDNTPLPRPKTQLEILQETIDALVLSSL